MDNCPKSDGKWNRPGNVMADLHNHFATSDNMDGLLDKILKNVVKKRMTPGVLGVIDFNNFGERSRFAQLERQAGDRAHNFGNALYFPTEDLLLIKGQEVPTREGHLLVLGLNRGKHIQPDKTLDSSLKEARDYNGIAIVDHPFSSHHGLGNFLISNRQYLPRFDAWEVFNSETAIFKGANEKAREVYDTMIKRKYDIGALAGTDGHSIYEIGRSSTWLHLSPYDSYKNSDDVTEDLRTSIRLNKDPVNRIERPALIGAIDHMADLATIIALSKLGINV